MAANEYYHTTGAYNHPPSYDDVPPRSPDPFHRPPPSPSIAGSNPYHHADDELQHPQHSQQTLASDNEAYPTGGRANDIEHYSENIPLKSQNQYANAPPPGWMQQPTQYPPPDMMDPPMNRAGRKKKKGLFQRKIAWVTYLLTTIQIIVFIVELVKSAQLTGSPIEIHPSFNYMIGPSAYIQINMGARYTPCMKNVDGIQNNNATVSFPCPNATTSATDCTLSELCGFSGVPNPHGGGSLDDRPEPDQWFRFIIPMFLHSGFIHIGFNMLAQLTMGADLEKLIGWWRYSLVYFASGIFGFVLGGNYSGQGLAVTGCSGCLFGIMAICLLDLFYTWKDRPSPWVELIIMVVGVGISFFLGLLPGLDNFAHIGGFIMGLALGLCILRSPNTLRERIGLARNPYVAMSGGAGTNPEEEDNKTAKPGPGFVDFFKGRRGLKSSDDGTGGLLGFFKGRKPLWWAWWLVRLGALVAVIIGFILLIVDFYKYYKSNCSWCYRLSCLPIKDWCEEGQLNIKST